MEHAVEQALLKRNEFIVQMVIEKIKKEYPEDIALIGLTGSFQTGDYHQKSDLDLIIVNETPRGWGISFCFILDDVGFDIYCTPWEPRIEAQASLESPMVSCLLDMQILYCAKPEYLQKLQSYRDRALAELQKPIGKDCLDRANEHINLAKQELADAWLEEDIGSVRYAAGGALYHLINAIVSLNNTYLRRGTKRYLDELRGYEHLPENFEQLYMAVIRADTVMDLRAAARDALRAVVNLRRSMAERYVEQPTPSAENLKGTYEELWSNCRNKVLNSVAIGDAAYAFQAALGAQSYLDEMTEHVGVPKFDVMASFDSGDLTKFQEAFLQAMEDYRAEYDKAGLAVERFHSLDALYQRYMGL